MSSNVPFMMPKRVAHADPYKPIQDATGSGPYVLEKGKWQPGSEAFYAENMRYVPRAEPELLAAGGKIAKADEIELRFFPNQADAVNALLKGDIDYLELPSIKFLPALEADPNITVALHRSTRQYRHHALQFRAAAVQQSEDPARRAHGAQSGRLHDGGAPGSPLVANLLLGLSVRHGLFHGYRQPDHAHREYRRRQARPPGREVRRHAGRDSNPAPTAPCSRHSRRSRPTRCGRSA